MVDQAVAKKASELDFQWWFYRARVAKAKADLELIAGRKLTGCEWQEIKLALTWYRKRRRVQPSKLTELTFDEWEDVRRAVRKLRSDLAGKSLDEAVAIVSTLVRVNRHVLNGMCADVRVWGT